MYNIGVDVGGSHIGVALVNENGEIVTQKPYSEDLHITNFVQIIEGIKNGIIYCINAEKVSLYDIKKIGIAAPGRHQNGKTITWGGNIQIFDTCTEKELRSALKKNNINCNSMGIKIANDAHCAALAELRTGSLRGCKNAICLTFGTGVGGGIIIDGKLYTGDNNLAGRVGHTLIDMSKKTGKEGSSEKICSIKTLKKNISEEKKLKTIISGRELIELLENKDKVAEKYFEEFKKNLYKTLESLIYIISPERISIGGSLAYLDKFFLEELRERLSIHTKERNDTEIVIAKHKNDAGIIGAAML